MLTLNSLGGSQLLQWLEGVMRSILQQLHLHPLLGQSRYAVLPVSQLVENEEEQQS